MTTQDYTSLYAAAIAEASLGSEVLPDGGYRVKIGSVKPGTAKSGAKPQVGIRLDVIEGPYSGKSTWVNQTFSAENPKAIAVFLRIMKSFGVPDEAITAGLPPHKLAEYIVIGSTGIAELGHHDWNENSYQDVKKFSLDGGSAVGPVAAAVAPVVSVAPAQVAPVAPVAVVPAPAVVAAPVAPALAVAPAPAEPAPVVAQPVVVAAPAPGAPPF